MRKLILASTAFFGLMAPAAQAPAQLIYGLVGSDRVVTFDAATPGVLTSNRPIVGLAPGDVLTGIDVRPADRSLYSVGQATGLLYRLAPLGGAYLAVPVGPLATPVTGSGFGIDFNPTVDRLRLVSNADQNLRINPTTGLATVDGTIVPFQLTGSAYANNFMGATATTLFGIDGTAGLLVRSINPNAGLYVPVGPLGLLPTTPDARIGFDIRTAGGNTGFAAINDSFYTIDLNTGFATLVGGIGDQNIRGISAGIPEPATWVMIIGGFALAGIALRSRPRRTVQAA